MTRVVWTRPAHEDLREIRSCIARGSAHYARVVAARLVSAVDRPHDFPLSGRAVPELARANLGEVIEGTYRIVYRVTAEEVQVLTVVHGALQVPAASTIE